MVCRFNPRLFLARMREVGGLSFDTAPRVPSRGVPELPRLVPFVDHRYGRAATLNEPVVALSLYEVVNMATGQLHVTSRQELAARFLIPVDATIVLSGVDKDGPIERWWELPNRPEIFAELARLGVALVTAPNYSVLLDVPRTDNLYAMKRILLAWTEVAAAGLRAALHVNARTDHDYHRWADLIAKRPEIETLAFEFATGGGRGERIDWHVDQLCKLTDQVSRPLTLVIRGGGRKAPQLRRHFASVTLIDTEAFARAIRRRRAMLTESGRLKWASSPTPKGAPIDDLFAHNVEIVRLAHELGVEPAPRLRLVAAPRRAPDRNDQPIQSGLLGDLEVSAEAGGIAPEPQRVIAAAKA
ncbi:MAG: DUF4417 domain-containing protein [Mesorhizobium sp.]|nr:DUF4417 domain-containing protein [Mesorhizobium sp. M5C.F.Cr.IN.023.01.1.1]RWF88709.1 MAG: DUF4417 domain-containing protein [Mesorhizobium sp.]RWF92971.1 MAG: DUF4417 domain-containing protein [Mesorhizobium sp.]RWI41523.1 MAG: DUF4417 domain-containing protein [Mesorhizobium sp.]RWI49824.1 MAG: DUF4417 domain-containing protein [Mesorhizobium sp.]